jgi:hypothetical protein
MLRQTYPRHRPRSPLVVTSSSTRIVAVTLIMKSLFWELRPMLVLRNGNGYQKGRLHSQHPVFFYGNRAHDNRAPDQERLFG